MKQLLQQYAAYNTWANKRIIETANQLPEDQINKEIISSFPSVYKTVMHMMEVENAWWERLKLVEQPALPGWFMGNFDELSKKLLQLSQQWQDWIKDVNETSITHVFAYYNSKKEYFKQPVYECYCIYSITRLYIEGN
ncbi:MAG TPA: DinB family protein [Chitinophagaceae bacterium]|nr:DinB family protein [Chitinophagaceae bacterium]